MLARTSVLVKPQLTGNNMLIKIYYETRTTVFILEGKIHHFTYIIKLKIKSMP